MRESGIRRDCFGYVAGKKDCQVLTENICLKRKCPFFKTKEDYQRGLKGLPPLKKEARSCGGRAKAVRCIETGDEFPSVSAAADAFRLPQRAIASVCRGEKVRIGAYRFVYVEDEKR